jgi:hypothetical protein
MATNTNNVQASEIRIQTAEIAPSHGTRAALVIVPADGSKPRVTQSENYPPQGPTIFEALDLSVVVGSWAVSMAWPRAGEPTVDIRAVKRSTSDPSIEATLGTKQRSITATVPQFGDKPELTASGGGRPTGAPECELRLTVTSPPYVARGQYKAGDSPKLEIEDQQEDLKAAVAQTRSAQQEALMKALQIEVTDRVTGAISYVPAYVLDDRRGAGLEIWQRNPHAPSTGTVTYRLDPAKEAGISLLAEKMP